MIVTKGMVSRLLAISGVLFAVSIRCRAQEGNPPITDEQPHVERRVLAFYYPWYGTPDGPGGAGRTVHWGTIDAANYDIAASTHYPALGAYDSHDPAVIDRHCRWAEMSHIDGFIVSWWGHDDYTDRAMPKILDACRTHGRTACIYYETAPGPKTPQTAAQDIIRALEKYGRHEAYLKVNGRPVVFIYGRALEELGLLGWREAVNLVKAGYAAGATILGDQFSYGAARVFDGVHTYNTAGSLSGLSLEEAEKWAAGTYGSWVQLADEAQKISTITIIPGYDDTKIRKPGLAVQRFDGNLYCMQWDQAIAAGPDWVLITSFNEWHEGSEIEPSREFGNSFIELTSGYAPKFKSTVRKPWPVGVAGGLTQDEKARLRETLGRIPLGMLPGPESTAFWWLLDVGVEPKVLTWAGIVDEGLSAKDYPLVLYCAGETYQRTVHTTGDVDAALQKYLQEGGCLAVLPSLPWPFYYDETGTVVNQGHRFGLTLRIGWERPPSGMQPRFVQVERRMPHAREPFDFPTAGDLRWRPFYASGHVEYIPLLRLQGSRDEPLGDAVIYARPNDGGHIAYAWFGLLKGSHAEPILYDLFMFVAERIAR